MKNILKDKKVIIGGVVVLGLIAFYYNKGKKVLAKQTPNSYSSADGTLTSSATPTNFNWGGLGATTTPINASSLNQIGGSIGFGNALATQSREIVLQNAIANQTNGLTVASGGMATAISNGSREAMLQQSLAQFQANSLSSSATTTPIVTKTGIKVLPTGILQPIGLTGVVTTVQAGLLGTMPEKSVKEIQLKVEQQVNKLKKA